MALFVIGYVPGSYCLVENGAHNGLYGKVCRPIYDQGFTKFIRCTTSLLSLNYNNHLELPVVAKTQN